MTDRTEPRRSAMGSRVARLSEAQLRVMERQMALLRDRGAKPLPGGTGPADADEVPMLPNTTRYLERDNPSPAHWNLGVLLVPSFRLDPVLSGRVVAGLLERFESLRLRFRQDTAGWTSFVAPVASPPPFAVSDLSSAADPTRAIEERCSEIQASLDLEQGPMIRVELFELGERGQRLLVVVHHFVMDQMSWPPFWEAFEGLYRSLERGAAVALPPVETSFVRWAEGLSRYADSSTLAADRPFWLGLPWSEVRPIPIDHPGGSNTNGSAAVASVAFDQEETSSYLRGTPVVTRKSDLVLGALARVIAQWSDTETVLVDMMCHGRSDELVEGLDPLATVGFLICYTPLVLTLREAGSDRAEPGLADQIGMLLERRTGFDLLRFMCADPAIRRTFAELPRAEVLFNYHGQRDEPDEVPRSDWFRAAPESIGPTHDPDGIRYYPLAVGVELSQGRMLVDFVYSRNLHQPATIERLAEAFRRQLLRDIEQAAG